MAAAVAILKFFSLALIAASLVYAPGTKEKEAKSKSDAQEYVVISGSTHPELAQLISTRLKLPKPEVLKPLKFSNKEIGIKMEQSVRGKKVFIVQTESGEVSDSIMELLIIIQTCKISAAEKIYAVIPLFPYARQDRKTDTHGPISAKLMAGMLEVAGADHVITMDLHAPQIQGFFKIPSDNLYAGPMIVQEIKKSIMKTAPVKNYVVVSPDAGGAKRAEAIAQVLGTSFAMLHKVRSDKINEVARMTLIGDVKDKEAIIVDDMVDTAGTLCKAAKELEKFGAKKIYAFCVHGILSGNALKEISGSVFTKVYVTNTVPQTENLKNPKIEAIDVSSVFAEAIKRNHEGQSLSSLFQKTPDEEDAGI